MKALTATFVHEALDPQETMVMFNSSLRKFLCETRYVIESIDEADAACAAFPEDADVPVVQRHHTDAFFGRRPSPSSATQQLRIGPAENT
jgi:hypothetical protein